MEIVVGLLRVCGCFVFFFFFFYKPPTSTHAVQKEPCDYFTLLYPAQDKWTTYPPLQTINLGEKVALS